MIIGRQATRERSEAQAPGKLYIAGEYAVVEAGHPALLIAVNRFITVRIRSRDGANPADGAAGNGGAAGTRSDARGSVVDSHAVTPSTGGHIYSEGHQEAAVAWHRDAQGVCTPDDERPGAAFIIAAIRSVEQIAQDAGVAPRYFDTRISSELDHDSGRKYGLGSSAAVTVATVKALLGFYGLVLEPMAQYKLAFIASSRAQRVGSGGDLAASLFGGCIRFCAVDRAWVKRRMQDTSVSDLIAMPWPNLQVTRLRVFGDDRGPRSPHSEVLVGWSGHPASTDALVTNVQGETGVDRRRRYQEFLTSSDRCVDALAVALTQGTMDDVRAQIGVARALLADLSTMTGTVIETAELSTLIDIALRHGAASKSSGAGGGDCGIAIVDDPRAAQDIRRDWSARGIVPLDLTVCPPLADAQEWQDDSSRRKDDHVRFALRQHESEGGNAFDDLRFIHHGLHGVSLSTIDTSTTVCGRHWTLPLYINAMTGGSERTGVINGSLSRVARATGLAMASGSQHAALRDPSLQHTFTVIREHTSGFVFANVGPTVTPAQAVQAVRMLRADALQIHINLAQEIVMPEGDRDFSAWPERIRAIATAVQVPVVVKEVGFGMSRSTIQELAALGVGTVDVSGRGGTDFAAIENARRALGEYDYLDQWGQSTVLCLLESSAGPDPVHVDVLASGGVRTPLDVVKALALGAKAVGVSGHFLHVLQQDGEQGLIEEIGRWGEQLRSLMALLGARNIAELRHTDLLLGGVTAQYAGELGVDAKALAHRSRTV